MCTCRGCLKCLRLQLARALLACPSSAIDALMADRILPLIWDAPLQYFLSVVARSLFSPGDRPSAGRHSAASMTPDF
jgi:hypothetical protein